jgi:hypothetical protein
MGGLLLGLLVVVPLADRWLLWKRPLWLLRLPDRGLLLFCGWNFDAQIPKVLPLLSQLFGVLKHRPQVLDAWVAHHKPTIKQRFSALPTVEQRRHHLDLPVEVGQRLEPGLTAKRLQELGAVGGLVLISGEDGVGKTSLAVRIAGWALAGELTGRPAVPVLVEADLQDEESLLSRVRSALAALCEQRRTEGGMPPPSLPLMRALLERRRLRQTSPGKAPSGRWPCAARCWRGLAWRWRDCGGLVGRIRVRRESVRWQRPRRRSCGGGGGGGWRSGCGPMPWICWWWM